MAGMAPQGNGNGQSNLSSPASSRRLPMLRAETVSLASLGVLYLIIVIIDNFELAKKIEEEFRPLSLRRRVQTAEEATTTRRTPAAA